MAEAFDAVVAAQRERAARRRGRSWGATRRRRSGRWRDRARGKRHHWRSLRKRPDLRVGCAESAGLRIAGKIRAHARRARRGRGARSRQQVRDPITRKVSHSSAESRGVESVDGESSVAALRAADAAGKQGSGTAGGIGERGIDDLHEVRIVGAGEAWDEG